MRRPRQTVSAVAELQCSASAVWRVLTTEKGYKEWFGFPEREDLVFIDPDFSVGAKLNFKGLSTMIITSMQSERELSFSDSSNRISFLIDPVAEGVEVSVTLDNYIAGRDETVDSRRFCAETLKALKKAAGAIERYNNAEPTVEEISPSVPFSEFLKRVFIGYRSPVSSTKMNEAGGIYSAIIDNTEMSVTIARRALLFAVLLIVFFFSSITVSLSFQRSDIVPSSGLSLFESDEVNKYLSTLIRIGDEKQNLELKLSCQGERVVSRDGSIEYHYTSVEKTDDGLPCERIIVIYDAYGKVRRYAYTDAVQSDVELLRLPLSRKIKEGFQYYELADINVRISPSMNIYEVEDIVGSQVSAYVVEKNQDGIITTLFFGKFCFNDIFSSNYRSQIVVNMDEAAGTTSVEFFRPIDENSPLPVDELSKTLRKQYAGIEEYLADRFAFERIFLALEISPEQAEILLSATGRPVAAKQEETRQVDETAEDITTDEIKDEAEEEEDEAVDDDQVPRYQTIAYRIRNPDENSRTYYRYSYDIVYSDGISETVSFKNERLAGYPGNTLEHLNRRSFFAGMSYENAVALAGMLPSAAVYTKQRFILYYGQEIVLPDTDGPIYPLCLTFSADNGKLLHTEFYQEPDLETHNNDNE